MILTWLLIRHTFSEFDPDLSLMEYEQEGYGLTRSLGSSKRDIFLVAQDQEIFLADFSLPITFNAMHA